jgi:mitogen-activated protein kinase kinase kinase
VFWTAPEAVVASAPASGKADVWSVGCFAIAMLTGAHPWPALEPAQVIAKMRTRSIPDFPSDATPERVAFLTEVFKYDVDDRPSAEAAEQHTWFRE